MSKKASAAPLRVFVGTSAGGEDAEACAALEAGLRRRASVPVSITWLTLSREVASAGSGWKTDRWATPWTALRWSVPAVCAYRGRAIYFDCTTLVLGDVAELGSAEIPAGAFLLARQMGRDLLTHCLVFDCVAAREQLPKLSDMKADVGAHQWVGALLERKPRLVGPLPEGWGRDDRDFGSAPNDVTKSVTFAVPHTQPHGPVADARLAREGRTHWFAGVRLPHYSQRLLELWREESEAAAAAGLEPSRYAPSEPWGGYAIGGADRVIAGRT